MVTIFYAILFLGILAMVCFDFFTWRQVSKLKKHSGFDREQAAELFWELYTQAQVEAPPPVPKEEQVQGMVLLALDRLGKLPVSEKPKENGHEPDTDEILSHIVGHTSVIAEAKLGAPAPQVTQVETANIMCKCGDGPFTDAEMKSHMANGMRKREKGRHGWPKKEKVQ